MRPHHSGWVHPWWQYHEGMHVDAKCPIRFGEPCTLCVPGAHGPQDCQLVALVKADPELAELRSEMIRAKREHT